MAKTAPMLLGFAAGDLCSVAAVALMNDGTVKKIKRKTNRTMQAIGNVASDIADMF